MRNGSSSRRPVTSVRARHDRAYRRAAGALVLALLGPSAGAALATDHLLAGTHFIARSRSGREKLVWISKDAAVVLPASPPSVTGAVLVVSASDGDGASVTLGSGSWSETTSRAKYVNHDAPGGDSACRTALIGPGRLKVVCKDDLIDTLDDGPEGGVAVRLTVGSDRYCASFVGVTKDERGEFVARHAPAPGACDQVPTTTTTVTSSTPTTLVFCGTTTTIAACGNQAVCGFGGICPQTQSCADDGTGHCDCFGPSVPCGNVGHPALCQYGDCPPGMRCVSLFFPPSCAFGCGCQ